MSVEVSGPSDGSRTLDLSNFLDEEGAAIYFNPAGHYVYLNLKPYADQANIHVVRSDGTEVGGVSERGVHVDRSETGDIIGVYIDWRRR